jgi:hypothetical protein
MVRLLIATTKAEKLHLGVYGTGLPSGVAGVAVLLFDRRGRWGPLELIFCETH